MITPLVIGTILALALGALMTAVGMIRDRAYYPVIAIVVASYYVLFAAIGGSAHALVLESLVMAAFAVVAIAGFRRNVWLAVCALAAHGLFDAVHGQLITNTGVPEWWPAFCGAFDVAAGGYAWWLFRVRAPTPIQDTGETVRCRLMSTPGPSAPISRNG
jgi:hypothetical protein